MIPFKINPIKQKHHHLLALIIGVSIAVGQMAFILIFCVAYSMAADFTKPITSYFDAA